ncbi:hypothetical protein DAEQUDRAFT_728110 [Daedalea quercina L-15889]|uniref:Uncharacterized protein n=1 Tax=Daedalea quercina L-15889 TaxID=1314783 RepID=A0A165PJX1_9APHY|nr:hypothetical protein DAEQUDRAFT_728110 [Daedalea quercina L-15889]
MARVPLAAYVAYLQFLPPCQSVPVYRHVASTGQSRDAADQSSIINAWTSPVAIMTSESHPIVKAFGCGPRCFWLRAKRAYLS